MWTNLFFVLCVLWMTKTSTKNRWLFLSICHTITIPGTVSIRAAKQRIRKLENSQNADWRSRNNKYFQFILIKHFAVNALCWRTDFCVVFRMQVEHNFSWKWNDLLCLLPYFTVWECTIQRDDTRETATTNEWSVFSSKRWTFPLRVRSNDDSCCQTHTPTLPVLRCS